MRAPSTLYCISMHGDDSVEGIHLTAVNAHITRCAVVVAAVVLSRLHPAQC